MCSRLPFFFQLSEFLLWNSSFIPACFSLFLITQWTDWSEDVRHGSVIQSLALLFLLILFRSSDLLPAKQFCFSLWFYLFSPLTLWCLSVWALPVPPGILTSSLIPNLLDEALSHLSPLLSLGILPCLIFLSLFLIVLVCTVSLFHLLNV